MKKIWKWLSGNVIKDVGEVIDNLTTTDEEKLQIKKEIQVIVEKAAANAEDQITKLRIIIQKEANQKNLQNQL